MPQEKKPKPERTKRDTTGQVTLPNGLKVMRAGLPAGYLADARKADKAAKAAAKKAAVEVAP